MEGLDVKNFSPGVIQSLIGTFGREGVVLGGLSMGRQRVDILKK